MPIEEARRCWKTSANSAEAVRWRSWMATCNRTILHYVSAAKRSGIKLRELPSGNRRTLIFSTSRPPPAFRRREKLLLVLIAWRNWKYGVVIEHHMT